MPRNQGSLPKEKEGEGKMAARKLYHTRCFVWVSDSQSVFWGPTGVPEILSGVLEVQTIFKIILRCLPHLG